MISTSQAGFPWRGLSSPMAFDHGTFRAVIAQHLCHLCRHGRFCRPKPATGDLAVVGIRSATIGLAPRSEGTEKPMPTDPPSGEQDRCCSRQSTSPALLNERPTRVALGLCGIRLDEVVHRPALILRDLASELPWWTVPPRQRGLPHSDDLVADAHVIRTTRIDRRQVHPSASTLSTAISVSTSLPGQLWHQSCAPFGEFALNGSGPATTWLFVHNGPRPWTHAMKPIPKPVARLCALVGPCGISLFQTVLRSFFGICLSAVALPRWLVPRCQLSLDEYDGGEISSTQIGMPPAGTANAAVGGKRPHAERLSARAAASQTVRQRRGEEKRRCHLGFPSSSADDTPNGSPF